MTDIGSFTLTGSSVGFGINSAGHIRRAQYNRRRAAAWLFLERYVVLRRDNHRHGH